MHNKKNQKPNVISLFVVVLLLLLSSLSEAASQEGGPSLEAVLSKSGVRGRFVFSSSSEAGKVKVSARLRFVVPVYHQLISQAYRWSRGWI